MNNNTIPIDHISSEQYSNIDNQQNDTKLKEVVNEMKKSPMTPTPLYVSFSSHLNFSLKKVTFVCGVG